MPCIMIIVKQRHQLEPKTRRK